MNYIIAREGWPFCGAALALFIVALAISWMPLTVLTFLLFLFVVWFFRNPERKIPEGEGIIVSPADGTVLGIDHLEGNVLRVKIFMSVFNVHVNRIPCDGIVKKIEYNKGKFLVASKDKASLDNEQNAITLTDRAGREIKFVQIAGLVARRIVCHIKPGDKVERGIRFGMIRFGSRVDVYLPNEFAPAVKKGDKTRAGETVLAHLGSI